ncbi:DMT family transporter [Streptomyces yaizuensis]|uniref:DMT family transporter n=1 Tax=Streptomyces yaizuensis TaxID=2989713 RepID=A0ABQ5P944_9ACTN|nr:DMT family transporter [Streptomyces sp. YSPA8]GLF99109.1 DMT family transporter [Streptomyces sp. YSPA8]
MTFDPTGGLALSVLLSLVSAIAYAGGAIVQERVASTTPEGLATLLRTPGWWAANSLNGTGALLHVVALACGPLSVVQPLGALTIVFALPLAVLCTGRRAGATAWQGAAMATAGLAGLLALTGSAGTGSLAAADRAPLACASFAAVAALTTAGRAARRSPVTRGTFLACAAGVAYGVGSVFTKAAAVDWAAGNTAGALTTVVVIAAFAAAGTVASQASYRGAGLATPLAVVTVVNPVVAAVIGMALLGESFRYGGVGSVLALGAGAMVAGGLTLLTRERVRSGTAGPQPQGIVDVDPVRARDLREAAAGAARRVRIVLPAPFTAAPRLRPDADADGGERPAALSPAGSHA